LGKQTASCGDLGVKIARIAASKCNAMQAAGLNAARKEVLA
jgi:hypothetical protein